MAAYSVTVVENIYCLGTSNRGLVEAQRSNSTSGLIAFFIWRTHSNVSQVTSSSLQVPLFAWSRNNDTNLIHSQSILRVFIESAGMWVFFVILTGIVYLFSLEGYMLVLYMVRRCFHVQTIVLNPTLPRRRQIPSLESPPV